MKEFFFDKSFSQAEIENFMLSGNEYENCLFDGCILSSLSFEKSIFIDCIFSQCDINNVSLKSTALKVMRDFAIKVNLFSSQNCPKSPKSSSFFEIKILFTAQKFLRCATIFSAKFKSLLYSNLKYFAALKDD